MTTFRELEDQVKQELEDEVIEEKKEILKERLRELREARKTIWEMEKQYGELLEKDIEEID